MTKYYILYETEQTIGVFSIGHSSWDNLKHGWGLFRGQIRTDVVDVVAITNELNLEKLVEGLVKKSPEKEIRRGRDYL